MMGAVLQVVGGVLAVLGFVAGFSGCATAVNPDLPFKQDDLVLALSSWAMFVGGCVVFSAGTIVNRMNPPSP